MAKQQSPFTLHGSVGQLSFYDNKLYGPVVRSKGGPSKDQIKKGKQFEPVRKNNTEFGRSSSYAGSIRHSFNALERHCKDGSMHTRLMTRIRELLVMDPEQEWGKRDLRLSALEYFRHFELDASSVSSRYFELPVSLEPAHGELDVYAGIKMTKTPRDADGWKLISVAASIDLAKKKILPDIQESDIYEIEKGQIGIGFHHKYKEDLLLFHGMGIVFYRYDATILEYVPLKEAHVNAGYVKYVKVKGSKLKVQS